MKSAHWRIAIPVAVLIGAAAAPAFAQRPPSPERRIMVLEQQLSASQASAIRLDQRLSAIERQLQQLINQGEVGGHRIAEIETAVAKLRSDMDSRLTALESRPVVSEAEPVADEQPVPVQAKPKSKQVASVATTESSPKVPTSEAAVSDPGEEAYSEGFRLWQDGKYDRAITALRAFTAAFPKHRRVSFANNLIGRALLDKGQPRPAAEALLANYRSNPKGERAPDSLYYLGQALMELNQPGQACKAYAELEDVYGAAVRPDLRTLVNKGKSAASCS
jgi:TolA-binding protein